MRGAYKTTRPHTRTQVSQLPRGKALCVVAVEDDPTTRMTSETPSPPPFTPEQRAWLEEMFEAAGRCMPTDGSATAHSETPGQDQPPQANATGPANAGKYRIRVFRKGG